MSLRARRPLLPALLLVASACASGAAGPTSPGVVHAPLAEAAPVAAPPAPAVEPEQTAGSGCDAAALAAAAEADAWLRETSVCDADQLARLAAGVAALQACAVEVAPVSRWVFPVSGVRLDKSIGGRRGSGFRRARNLPCFAVARPGHPAHDLFVPDRGHGAVRDAEGNPFYARAVETGLVLVAHDGWEPGDAGKGGNYVMLYLPARRQIAYYAHLGQVLVRPGDRLEPGQVLGIVGRTGLNAWKRRSPSHLHFGLWEADTFRPVDSYEWLRAADDGVPVKAAPTLPPTTAP